MTGGTPSLLAASVRKAAGILSCLCLLFMYLNPTPAFASPGTLQLARDIVDATTPSQTNIGHSIYFVLPYESQQIQPSDWIEISMPKYSSIVLPTAFSGIYGTPTVDLIGTTIRLTNVVLLNGTGMGIDGISARNANTLSDEQIIISVCDDAACTLVRNQVQIEPSQSGNTVNVTATIDNPLSSLSISGFTSPNAFITLVEGPSVLGTTVSGGTGFFNFFLTALAPGNHSYKITGTDTQGRNTSQSTLNLYLLGANLTTVTSILLSPTISLDKTAINPGDTITMSGSTEPNNQINLFVEAPLKSYTVTADTNGNWTYTIPGTDTTSFLPGQYQTYAISQDGLGTQSQIGLTLNFTVNSPTTDPNNPAPRCDISHGDLNCDGKTSLTDFSILLYHWQTNHKVADINGDTKVNLTDFSIMMFYFTR